MVGRSEGCGLSSLSARRAWIEISLDDILAGVNEVALRKESVDRNTIPENPMISIESLSARRAWIEILLRRYLTWIDGVALRKESVDRNNRIAKPFREQFSRSPQGERG